jgi:hypothetical protein
MLLTFMDNLDPYGVAYRPLSKDSRLSF